MNFYQKFTKTKNWWCIICCCLYWVEKAMTDDDNSLFALKFFHFSNFLYPKFVFDCFVSSCFKNKSIQITWIFGPLFGLFWRWLKKKTEWFWPNSKQSVWSEWVYIEIFNSNYVITVINIIIMGFMYGMHLALHPNSHVVSIK